MSLDWIYTFVYLAWLGRRRLLRARPAPDELTGDRPERQPVERGRDDGRRRSRRSSGSWSDRAA